MTDPSIARLPSVIAVVSKRSARIRVVTPSGRAKAKLKQLNRSLSAFMYARSHR